MGPQMIDYRVVLRLDKHEVAGMPDEPAFERFELWHTSEFFYEVSFWTARLPDQTICPLQVMFRQDDFQHVFVALDHRGNYMRSGFAKFQRPAHWRSSMRAHALAASFYVNNPDSVLWGDYPEFELFRPALDLRGFVD